MEFEDADESCSGGGESRRGSLTPPSSMSRVSICIKLFEIIDLAKLV